MVVLCTVLIAPCPQPTQLHPLRQLPKNFPLPVYHPFIALCPRIDLRRIPMLFRAGLFSELPLFDHLPKNIARLRKWLSFNFKMGGKSLACD